MRGGTAMATLDHVLFSSSFLSPYLNMCFFLVDVLFFLMVVVVKC